MVEKWKVKINKPNQPKTEPKKQTKIGAKTHTRMGREESKSSEKSLFIGNIFILFFSSTIDFDRLLFVWPTYKIPFENYSKYFYLLYPLLSLSLIFCN